MAADPTSLIDADPVPAASTPPRSGPVRRVAAGIRNLWRSLTSMRTALVLLFLLALAAVPGAILPQRALNAQLTADYIQRHGTLGVWMDRLELFEVFSSFWFTAIYALLFVSLVGCLLPRLLDYGRAFRATPVRAPRNLARLPRRVTATVTGDPQAVAATVVGRMRGWRTIVRTDADADGQQIIEISAEKGFLRELGNLVFHFALLGILVTLALGKVYGYEGSRLVVAGDSGFCNATASYDSFRAGSMIDGTGLEPMCLELPKVTASYLPNGEPDSFVADVRYQAGDAVAANNWQTSTIRVNAPLRVDGLRVYMLGQGYAPTFTVTFPNGETRTQTVPFEPLDGYNLSSGAVRVDPPAGLYPSEDQRREHQIGIEGLFAPTKLLNGTLLTSGFPDMRDPAVAVDVYEGDTGLDSGTPQNVFTLSAAQKDSGRLVKKARVNLDAGQSTRLPDGTTVRFDGAQRFAALQVSHDPTQGWVLVFAILMLLGLSVSLTIKRRRVFARFAGSSGGGTVVEIAGLARTDQAGWGDGFADQVDRWLKGHSPAGPLTEQDG